jgi:hypothetical protein
MLLEVLALFKLGLYLRNVGKLLARTSCKNVSEFEDESSDFPLRSFFAQLCRCSDVLVE